MKSRIFLLLLLLFVIAVYSLSPVQADGIFSEDLLLQGMDFATGELFQVVVTEEGMELENAAASGSYTSPILQSPRPFNAVVPQWVADLPLHTQMTMRLRTANTDGIWNDWFDIVPNDDWMLPEDTDMVGNMVVVPEVDGTHTALQFTVGFNRLTAESIPLLKQLRFTFIDATAGPTSEELAAQARAEAAQNPHNPEDGYPKPPVVSRAVWCTDPACNYSEGLEYESVTHLIVHHTVSANTSTNWAAVVRAIWHFHTFTRGWGDIGYNYLVDMNGVLYEGHNGGDDVVGTHASGANAGSMALSFIGTFTLPTQNPPGITPPPAMLDAAVELFSWKADQKDIDVYDSSQLPDMGWGLPHVMGHRDAYGTTACPGEQAHDLVPWIRDAVANQIGFTPPHTYIDEQSAAFTKSNSSWLEGPNSCGYNVHAWYTRSTTGTASHWGRWQLDVMQPGWYTVEVYAPYCRTGFGDTHGARYEVHHVSGVNTVTVDQGDNLGLWVSLGDYYFVPGSGNYIYLTNKTATDSNLGIWFDAIRLRPQTALPPTVTIQQPPADAWLTNRDVTFSWATTNPSNINSVALEVATNANFTTLVYTETLNAAATTHQHTFSEDYRNLYWRVILSPVVGTTVTSTIGHFGLDASPPTSSVNGIYIYEPTATSYQVFWGGSDVTSGLAGYTIQYQAEGAATWTTWITHTTNIYADFTPPDPDLVYWFRSQAVDVAGNSEPPHTDGDISTEHVLLLDNRMMLPIIQR